MMFLSRVAYSLVDRRTAILLILALAGLLRGQTSSAQAMPAEGQKSTISGTVINGVTRAPIPRALVSTGDNRYATFTDSSGHFEFDLQKEDAEPSPAVAGGFIRTGPRAGDGYFTTNRIRVVSARKPGFLTEGKPGETAIAGREVTISLTPEALIVGRVTFSTPDTTSHVTVQLFLKQIQDGRPRWIQGESSTTNSAGEFRFANLAAGSYKLATNESLDNDPGAMISRSQVYGFPPVYYPNSPDFATASTIEVTAGQTVEADLSLVRQPYYNVRIPVTGDVSFGLNVTVSSQGHRGPGYSLGYNAAEHRMEGLLPNGNYVVDAVSYGENSASGTTNLRVAGGPANGSALAMVPNNGIALNVKEDFTDTQWNGSAQWNIGGRMVPVRGPRTYLNANLEPADDFGQGAMGGIRPPLTANDDSLVMTSVPPGRYWLRLNSSRGYVASATMGAIDVLHQPINVTGGSAASVDVTMRDECASAEGTVSGMQAKTDDPESQFVWIYFVPSPDSSGQFSQTAVQAGEQFRVEPLVPGTYRVLAFSHQQNLPYRDPQAMKAYESKSQVIHVAPGEKATLQIQAVSEE